MTLRTSNTGVGYLRRSTDKQEISLPAQLDWMLGEAGRLDVKLDATQADLDNMQARRLHHHKQLFLDDGITGADLERRGLRTMVETTLTNKQISHLFVFKRDRLGRPIDPLDMVTLESQLTRAGLTIVFSDGIAHPTAHGQTDLPHIIQMLFGYHQSGEFLNTLAENVIGAQRRLASEGFSTGGNPPYGFGRFLVGDGQVVEELSKGRTVRQSGYHVRWLPKDDSKIKVWIYILDLKNNGWGTRRIAKHLNDLGIPSPQAGMVRRDSGVQHAVSGKWNPNTVAELCRNRAILGLRDYGRRSEGKHRRLGADGPRLLEEDDFGGDGKPRVLMNNRDVQITAEAGFDPRFDADRWGKIQEQMRQRSTSQRGIRRAKDPTKYPLATRVVDLTENCGALMYGITSGKRRIYECGRYRKTTGSQCHHNTVDAEALLRFLLKSLSTLVSRHGGKAKLRKLLEVRANSAAPVSAPATGVDLLGKRVADLRGDLEIAERRMAREKDDARYEALARQFDQMRMELRSAEQELETMRRAEPRHPQHSPQQEVDAALRLLDQISKLAENPKAREELGPLLQKLDIWIGLNFGEALKGKKRRVRRLLGGVISFGGNHLPAPLHGHDNREGKKNSAKKSNRSGQGHSSQGDEVCAGAGPDDERHQEGTSSTMCNRGDRRWTFPNESIGTQLFQLAVAQVEDFTADTFFSLGSPSA